MLLAPPPFFDLGGTSLINTIRNLAQETSLQWVVDFGDPNCIASGAQQTLGTIPAGGSTFTRGPDSGVDAQRDGTFVGTIGGQSSGEYLSVNGTTVLPLGRVSSPRATWSDNAHKDAALFTFAALVYRDAGADGGFFFHTCTGLSTSVGVMIGATLDGHANPNSLFMTVGNAGGFAATIVADTLPVPTGAATFIALSADEAAGSFCFQVNGSQQVVSATYSSPSSGNAALTEANVTAANNQNTNTGRVYNASWWNRALSAGELTALYRRQKSKFGI